MSYPQQPFYPQQQQPMMMVGTPPQHPQQAFYPQQQQQPMIMPMQMQQMQPQPQQPMMMMPQQPAQNAQPPAFFPPNAVHPMQQQQQQMQPQPQPTNSNTGAPQVTMVPGSNPGEMNLNIEAPDLDGDGIPDENVEVNVVMQPVPDSFYSLPNNSSFSLGLTTPPVFTGTIPLSSLIEIPPPPRITDEEARAALLKEVEKHFCWGKRPAQNMTVQNLSHSNGFQYTLESFTESRTTAVAIDPYYGQPIDGPENGPPPLPWSILANPPGKFINFVMKVEVPHTAVVKQCYHCGGCGEVQCRRCVGRGRVRCSSCFGRGHRTVYRDGHSHHETCFRCHGDGKVTCWTCLGSGRVQCPTCKGHGRLKSFIELTITWENHVDHELSEKTDLPDHLIVNAQGKTLFEEENDLVAPISSFPDQIIVNGSAKFVKVHFGAWPMSRILGQRQTIRAIPVSEIDIKHGDKSLRYFVYGTDHLVHFPDYPARCCCLFAVDCCTIL